MADRSIASAFSSVAIAKIIGVIVGAATTPLLTRILGSSNYGKYATIMAIFGLSQILMSSGVMNAAQAYFPQSRGDRWEDELWGFLFRIAGALAILFSFTYFSVAYIGGFEKYFGEEFTIFAYLVGLYAIFMQYREFIRRVLMGLHKERFSEILHLLNRVLFSILAISLAILGFDVIGVLTGQILSSLFAILVGLIILRRYVDLSYVYKPVSVGFPRFELISYNNYNIVFMLFLTSLYHVDVIVLQQFVPSSSVGHYKAALILVEMMWIIPISIQQVLIQSVSKDWEEGNIKRIRSITNNATRLTLLVTLLLAIGLAILADSFVPVYFGEQYSPAVSPLLILLFGTVGFALARPIIAVNQAKGDMKLLVISTGLVAVANVCLNILLIPRYGIEGAAIATSVSYGSLPLMQFFIAYRHGYLPVEIRPLLRVLITALLSSSVIYILANQLTGLTKLLIVPPLGGIIYILFAVLTGALRKDEINYVYDMLPVEK